MNMFSQWAVTTYVEYGPRCLDAAATLLVGWLVVRVVTAAFRKILKAARIDRTLASFSASLLYFTLWTLVIIAALQRLGFPTVSLAAVVGAAGLAIGLALRGLLSNFAAGLILMALRPFNTGDRVEAAGVSGTVDAIHVFATTIKLADDKRVFVPNASLTGGNITCYRGV